MRGNVVWNTMMVNKAFSKFIDGGFGRSTAGREGKSTCRVSVCYSEKKSAQSSMTEMSNIISQEVL